MTDDLPNPNLPSPSKAEAKIEGIREKLENRSKVVKEARDEADKEVAQSQKDKEEVEEKYQEKLDQLRHEKKVKEKKIENARRRAEKARKEADRMDAIMRFAKGEIGIVSLFFKTAF